MAEQLPGRMGKQCRERWYNHLKPEINKAAWTDEEERILINAHAEYGNKWSILAKLLPGRTENSVKNHWNCSLKKKLCNYTSYGFSTLLCISDLLSDVGGENPGSPHDHAPPLDASKDFNLPATQLPRLFQENFNELKGALEGADQVRSRGFSSEDLGGWKSSATD